MAKKIAPMPELTPAQSARAKAERIVIIDEQVKALKAESDGLKEELTAYVTETGETDLGALLAETRLAKPSIDFGSAMTPKQKQFVVETLLNQLPAFTKTVSELDLERLFFAINTDATVQNALKVQGVKLVQKETMAFKRPK